MSIEEQFEDAQQRVKKLSSRPSNDVLLDLYSLYKQASAGDVTGKRPGMMDFAGRAKWDAWKKRAGTTSAEAMQAYIDLIDRLGA